MNDKPRRKLSPQETLDRLAELDPEFIDPLREDWPEDKVELHRLICAIARRGGEGGPWLRCEQSSSLSPERLRERNLRTIRRAKELRDAPPLANPRSEDAMWFAWLDRFSERRRRREAAEAEASVEPGADDTTGRFA